MSDHEFEKQVQLKMEQFRLRPSNAVWAEVEKNIRKDKRRRRMIVWLPIALLFLGAGGYFAIQETARPAKELVSQTTPSSHNTPSSTQNNLPSTSTSTQQTQDHIQATTTAANTATAPDAPTRNTPIDTDQSTPGNLAATEPAHNPATPVPDVVTGKAAPAVTAMPDVAKSTTPKQNRKQQTSAVNAPPPANLVKKQPQKNNRKEDLAANTFPAADKQQADETTLPDVVQPDSSVAVVTTNNRDSAQTIQDLVTIDQAITTVDSNSLAQTTIADSVTIDSVQTMAAMPPAKTPEIAEANHVQKKAGPSKWQFGIQVEGGYSGVTKDGLFGFLEKNYTPVPDLASPAFSSVITFAPQFPRPVSKPSNLTMGLSFSAGGFVKRALTNRLSLTVGLQYAHLSTRQVVGAKVHNNRTVNRAPSTSQIVNEYYDANTNASFNNPNRKTQTYTNKYQFIELPVTLHTQLNKGKRLPITWDAGFSVSKLLSTNALHYDGLGGVYYKDKSLFNNTQWAVSTGLNVQLFKHTQHPLTVGPVMRYNITPMLKKDFSTGQHVWAVGLRASVLLKK